jgi:hypothetical protein
MATILSRRPELASLRATPGDFVSSGPPLPPPPGAPRLPWYEDPWRGAIPPADFVIIRDTREQAPLWERQPVACVTTGTLATGDYSVRGHEPASESAAVERRTLAALPPDDRDLWPRRRQIALERKSLEDLYATIGDSLRERTAMRKAGRPDGIGRGESQWRRLGRILDGGGAALVLIEATAEEIAEPAAHRPETGRWMWRSKYHPHVIAGALASWRERYGVPWAAAGRRPASEVAAWQWLASAWRAAHPGA